MKKLILSLGLIIHIFYSTAQEKFKYDHILITNDDGVEDADRLLALANNVKKVSKRVSVIVSSFDRSGTSNHTTFGKHQSTLEVTCKYHDEEKNIKVYVTPGNPADCVLLGLNGLFPDDKPDLVLSGINGGANIGPGWFGSGTIGAIRTAAFLGVRGIALSGFEDDDPRSFEVIPNWVTALIASEVIDEMGKSSYLTVGFPDMPLEEIKGVKLAPRKVSFDFPEAVLLYQIHGEDPHEPEHKSVWTVKYQGKTTDSNTEYDEALLKQGYIIVTPMSINENDVELYDTIKEMSKELPQFSLD